MSSWQFKNLLEETLEEELGRVKENLTVIFLGHMKGCNYFLIEDTFSKYELYAYTYFDEQRKERLSISKNNPLHKDTKLEATGDNEVEAYFHYVPAIYKALTTILNDIALWYPLFYNHPNISSLLDLPQEVVEQQIYDYTKSEES